MGDKESGPLRGKVLELMSRLMTATDWESMDKNALKRALSLPHQELNLEFKTFLANGPDDHEPLFAFTFPTIEFPPGDGSFDWQHSLIVRASCGDFSGVDHVVARRMAREPISCGYLDFARPIKVERMSQVAPVRCLDDASAAYILARLLQDGHLDEGKTYYLGTEIVQRLYQTLYQGTPVWWLDPVNEEDVYQADARFFFSAKSL